MSPISFPAPSTFTSVFPLTLAIPMASVVTLQQQLAPTMGQAEKSTRVLMRMGPSSSSSARCASGLVLRFGAFDYVVDNASQFGEGAPLSRSAILPIGSHHFFIVSVTDEYPREVRVFCGVTDPLPAVDCSAAVGSSTSRIRAEVMMAGATSSHHSSNNTAA